MQLLASRANQKSTMADDLIPKLEASITPAADAALRACIDACRRRGLSLYLVGGAVRDLLRGAGHLDLDVATEGETADVAEDVASRLGGRAVTHERFGTATVRGPGWRLDLARTRRETYERPGALPAVMPASLADDLARRDFSVNAIALRLTDPAGELIDPHGGRPDLDRRLVRVLHERSFQDDATRLLRAVRYAARLGFEIEPQTASWLQRDLGFLDTISGPRLRRELTLTFEDPGPDAALLAQRLGLLAAVHPALRIGDGVAQRWRDAIDGPAHALRDELGYCVLLQPAQADAVEALTARLHLTAAQRKALDGLVRLQDVSAKLAASPNDAVQTVELLEAAPPAAVWALAVREGGAVAQACEAYLTRWRRVRPLLRGNDLLALGVAPGPPVGDMLALLRRARLESRVATRDDELALVRGELR